MPHSVFLPPAPFLATHTFSPYTRLVPLKYLLPLLTVIGLLFVGLLFISPRIAIATAIMAVGFTMVWKTSWWIEMFGRNPWAESQLKSGLGAGAGGSWLFYKLLGILTMILAFLSMTGGLQSILVNTVGVFFSSGVYD